jgi:hypothetical protein
MVRSQPRHIVQEPLSWKNLSQKRAGGVVQGVGPEFKSQCHKNRQKKVRHPPPISKNNQSKKDWRHGSNLASIKPWVQTLVPLKGKKKNYQWLTLTIIYLSVCFWDKVLLCSSGWPWARDSPALAPQVLGS